MSKHPDPDTRKAIQALWARWCVGADADGMTDFYGMQALAVRQMIEGGECFGQLLPTGARGVPLQLRLIDADLVDAGHTINLPDGGQVVGGIEFDASGTRSAVYVSRRRPTDMFATLEAPIRVPVADILHLFNPLVPGQVRGIAWTAPVLARLQELDQFEDAQLVRQKVAAMFSGFLTDVGGNAATPFDGAQTGGILESGLEPGTLKILPPGFDIKFATPAEASQAVEWVKGQLRAVAAGLGVPDYLLTGDLSEANYSSLRSALVQFRRRVETLQFSVIIHQFCRPVWERFVTLAVLSGALAASDFESASDDYLSAEWYPPAQEWVDPLKDQQAEALAVASGFKSRRQSVAERGYDVEELDAEIAADHQREAALGLHFPVPPSDQKATPNAAS